MGQGIPQLESLQSKSVSQYHLFLRTYYVPGSMPHLGNMCYKQYRYGHCPRRTFSIAKKTLISQVTKPTNAETAGKKGPSAGA